MNKGLDFDEMEVRVERAERHRLEPFLSLKECEYAFLMHERKFPPSSE